MTKICRYSGAEYSAVFVILSAIGVIDRYTSNSAPECHFANGLLFDFVALGVAEVSFDDRMKVGPNDSSQKFFAKIYFVVF